MSDARSQRRPAGTVLEVSRGQRRAPPADRLTPTSRSAVPSVLAVLHESGQALNEPVRAVMEHGLGHDFSTVRVHVGGEAAAAAQGLEARAVTLGHHLVFGPGEYTPETDSGRRLIAHELTHVVQQSATTSEGVTTCSSAEAEREADRAARVVIEGGVAIPKHRSERYPARWAIKDSTATVDSDADRLGQLPARMKSAADNWVCIKPLAMKTAGSPSPPADFDAHYERYLQVGDRFDLANLNTGFKGGSLRLSLFDPMDNNHIVLKTLYPGTVPSKAPDDAIRATAGEGKTPVADLVVGGHQVGGAMYGGSGRFDLAKMSGDEPAPSFARAVDDKFPRRCWFTGFGTARSVGCSSVDFGNAFAGIYLRSGAGIDTTTRAIAPACSSTYRKPNGACESIDAVEFRPAPGEAKTPDHGPFLLSDQNAFHGSSFWTRIAGRL